MARNKIAVLGLGHFGLHLSLDLTSLGAEVLGVDFNQDRAEMLRDKIDSIAVADTTDPRALRQLGLTDFDMVIVAIGEDFQASILTTAHLQELNVKRIVNRVVTPVHERLLRLMNVDELILPEAEAASDLARRLMIKGVTGALGISAEFSVVEAQAPGKIVGKSVSEVDLRKRFQLNLVTIMRRPQERGLLTLGNRPANKVLGIPEPGTIFDAEDILLLFGKETDIRRFLAN